MSAAFEHDLEVAAPSGLTLSGVRKSFGNRIALDSVDLDVVPGEFVAVVGPSGSGKSTMLRLIAGLDEADEGHISIGRRPVNALPPHQRNVAMVFQSYALYPHLTVFRNIAAPLEIRRLPPDVIEARVAHAAELLDIAYLLNRRPPLLSGGQRQRVALARALVRDPALFLFDEPLSNLDASQRTSIRGEIVRLHRRLAATFIYVTHDQAEAMMLADRLVVLNKGRVEQVGAPQALYDRPANTFVASFLGAPGMNILPAGVLPVPMADGLLAGVRPEHLRNESTPGALPILAQAVMVETMGASTRVDSRIEGHPVVVSLASRHHIRPGDRLDLWVHPRDVHAFDAGSGRAVSTLHRERPQ